jgi:hypothetical protein
MLLLLLLVGNDETLVRRGVSFSSPKPPSSVFAILASAVQLGICSPLRKSSICTGELETFVATVYFNKQSGHGTSRDARVVLCQKAQGENGKAISAPMLCALLNHQAEGDLHIQRHQHCGSRPLSSAFPARLVTKFYQDCGLFVQKWL